MNFLKTTKKNNKGFVILIAVLLSSLFVIIGSAIFNIALKELVLTSGARESEFAFYAADAGIDCALYWDLKVGGVFATSTASVGAPTYLECAGQDVTQMDGWEWKKNATPTSAQTTFSFKMFPNSSDNRSDCVKVVVTKDSTVGTTVEARGYNTCDVANPRRVERGFKATY